MGEKVSNNATEKGLIFKIANILQLNNKIKQPNWKMGRKTEETFLQRRLTGGQQAHEKRLYITNY